MDNDTKALYDEYDSPERMIYGMMPLFGPVYLLGRYINFRWKNRKEISAEKMRRRGLGLYSEVRREF